MINEFGLIKIDLNHMGSMIQNINWKKCLVGLLIIVPGVSIFQDFIRSTLIKYFNSQSS